MIPIARPEMGTEERDSVLVGPHVGPAGAGARSRGRWSVSLPSSARRMGSQRVPAPPRSTWRCAASASAPATRSSPSFTFTATAEPDHARRRPAGVRRRRPGHVHDGSGRPRGGDHAAHAAIIPVALYRQPAPMPEILAIAERAGIPSSRTRARRTAHRSTAAERRRASAVQLYPDEEYDERRGRDHRRRTMPDWQSARGCCVSTAFASAIGRRSWATTRMTDVHASIGLPQLDSFPLPTGGGRRSRPLTAEMRGVITPTVWPGPSTCTTSARCGWGSATRSPTRSPLGEWARTCTPAAGAPAGARSPTCTSTGRCCLSTERLTDEILLGARPPGHQRYGRRRRHQGRERAPRSSVRRPRRLIAAAARPESSGPRRQGAEHCRRGWRAPDSATPLPECSAGLRIPACTLRPSPGDGRLAAASCSSWLPALRPPTVLDSLPRSCSRACLRRRGGDEEQRATRVATAETIGRPRRWRSRRRRGGIHRRARPRTRLRGPRLQLPMAPAFGHGALARSGDGPPIPHRGRHDARPSGATGRRLGDGDGLHDHGVHRRDGAGVGAGGARPRRAVLAEPVPGAAR